MEKPNGGEGPTAPGAMAGESVGYATWLHKMHKAVRTQGDLGDPILPGLDPDRCFVLSS